jgi:hypothetical protein
MSAIAFGASGISGGLGILGALSTFTGGMTAAQGAGVSAAASELQGTAQAFQATAAGEAAAYSAQAANNIDVNTGSAVRVQQGARQMANSIPRRC